MARNFEPRTDGPNLFWKQGSFLTDDPSFVPGFAFLGDCGKLDSWHNLPSDPPSIPKHQHSADSENITSVGTAIVKREQKASSLQVHQAAIGPF